MHWPVYLDELNRNRQTVEAANAEAGQGTGRVQAGNGRMNAPLVLAHEEWHPGSDRYCPASRVAEHFPAAPRS